jgi:hypothetical protein
LYFNSIPDGSWVAYEDGGTLNQTVGPTIAANTIYTLTVALGLRKDFPGLGTAELLINGTPYVATGSAPTLGNWSDFVAVYNSALHPADVGQAITISLVFGTEQSSFDNVRLDATPGSATVPEPATSGFIALGFTALVLLRVRRYPQIRRGERTEGSR